MELYIVRHGETVWNKETRLQGRSDIPLSESGIEVARKTGEGLCDVLFDEVYSSPLNRARTTAELIVNNKKKDICLDDRLKEISFGEYEGKTYDELERAGTDFKKFFDKPEEYKASIDGETIENICERAKSFLDDILKKYGQTDKRILIVAHGAINKAIMLNIKKLEIKDLWSGGLQKNCGVAIVKYEKGHFTVEEECKFFY